MEKLLLKPAEVSELVGLGQSKTYELIATGEIPSVRIGRSVRVPADRLREWIEQLKGGESLKDAQKGA
jgi:excisionase family DNA binding protein